MLEVIEFNESQQNFHISNEGVKNSMAHESWKVICTCSMLDRVLFFNYINRDSIGDKTKVTTDEVIENWSNFKRDYEHHQFGNIEEAAYAFKESVKWYAKYMWKNDTNNNVFFDVNNGKFLHQDKFIPYNIILYLINKKELKFIKSIKHQGVQMPMYKLIIKNK